MDATASYQIYLHRNLVNVVAVYCSSPSRHMTTHGQFTDTLNAIIKVIIGGRSDDFKYDCGQ